MTPTQLRAFATVVHSGSVKAAAQVLEVSEAAVSLHVAQLRKELGDALFTRASTGLAFTPGGLRLASRAVEILGLQDRTVREVGQAGHGQRLLRVAATSLFAEHAAPGLLGLFSNRAKDLELELSVHDSSALPALLASRAVDVGIGPHPAVLPPDFVATTFLKYEIVTVTGPGHVLAGRSPQLAQLRSLTWLLGPAAAGADGVVPDLLRRVGVPEAQQRIFQSDAQATEEIRRTDGVGLALGFAVAGDLANGRLVALGGPGLRAAGRWSALALPPHSQLPAAAELLRFITTPRATQAMLRGAGSAPGRFRPSVHVTLWN
ncbi:MAG: LysR family transcriptional regulator [Actinomycetota bacterium]|nr:LysR family transcriptional regulator [Actinomycetota bacterium]